MDFMRTFQFSTKCSNINSVWIYLHYVLINLKCRSCLWANIYDANISSGINALIKRLYLNLFWVFVMIKMTSNTISIVAFSGGLKCPRKIYFNTQWGRGAVFLPNWRRCRGGKTSIAPSVKGAPRCCLDQPTTTDSGCKNASIKLRHRNTNCYTRGNFSREKAWSTNTIFRGEITLIQNRSNFLSI